MKELKELPLLEAITECGIMRIGIGSTLDILAGRTGREALARALDDPESGEYKAYRYGLAKGNIDITESLHTAAILGSADSYHALSGQQRQIAVAEKIKENFGIG
jgi:hypothetical protein